MILRFTAEAEEALFEIGLWIEAQNTPGAGIRFINKFIEEIENIRFRVLIMGFAKAKY